MGPVTLAGPSSVGAKRVIMTRMRVPQICPAITRPASMAECPWGWGGSCSSSELDSLLFWLRWPAAVSWPAAAALAAMEAPRCQRRWRNEYVLLGGGGTSGFLLQRQARECSLIY